MNRNVNLSWTVMTLPCLFLMSATAQAGDEPYGVAACERGERDRDAPPTGCKIAWHFEGPERASYWIERFETSETGNGWIPQSDALQEPSGVTPEPVEGGFLYRAVGCSDDNRKDCITSTVVWAPAISANVEDLPEFVSTAEGVYTARSKNFSAEHQLVEYNMALLAKLLAEVDHSVLLPMTELPFRDLHNVPARMAQWDATMDYNMYMWYPVH